MALTYRIEDNNAVRIFEEGQEGSLFQPQWPNGDAWANAEEASNWAELYIAAASDKDAPYAPNARGESGKPKPSDEKIEAIQNAQKSLQNAKTLEEKMTAQKALADAYNL